MSEQSHRAQSQQRRTPARAHRFHGGGGHRQCLQQIGSVGSEIPQPRPGAEGRLDPVRGRGHADTEPIVFADEQHRHRDALVRGMYRGVDRADRGGVIGRCVPESTQHHRISRPRRPDAQAVRSVEGKGQAHCARQMGGDGGGLRYHRCRRTAENLVPPTRHRFCGGRDHTQQHIADRIQTGHLPGPPHEECPRAVVQQRRIGTAQCLCQYDIALVAARPDAVVAALRRAQSPRRQIQMPTGQLCVEQLQAGADGDRTAGADGFGRGPLRSGSRLPNRDAQQFVE